MRAAVEGLLGEVAGAWRHESRPTFRIIGSTALMLQTDYRRGTNDSDILETTELEGDIQEHLLSLAGAGTASAIRWRLHVQIVGRAIPFLPQQPLWHTVSVPGTAETFRIEVLDVVDVVLSKLKRFHSSDRDDIDAMVGLGLVPHHRLLERFNGALDRFFHDARADDVPRYIRNLNQVERDMLDVPETTFELPEWVDLGD